MRLRKFTAVSLAAAMTAAAITGCGNREQEKPDVKTEGISAIWGAERTSRWRNG